MNLNKEVVVLFFEKGKPTQKIWFMLDSDLAEMYNVTTSRLNEQVKRNSERFPILLTNKYHSLEDAKEMLGNVANISKLFIEFQEHLYKQSVA